MFKYWIISILTLFINFDVLGQKAYEVEMGDTLYFTWHINENINIPKELILQYPRFKDSLPDGIYRAYNCRCNCKKKNAKYLYLEASYINGFKDGQEIFYGYHFDKRGQPILSSITLTEYKNGKVNGLFIQAVINAENTVSIEAMKQYKNDSLNGISIYAPKGLIREILYYNNNEVQDTLWTINDTTNNIFYKAISNTFYKEDYLSGLLRNNFITKARKRDD
jgi:hypothetical protein